MSAPQKRKASANTPGNPFAEDLRTKPTTSAVNLNPFGTSSLDHGASNVGTEPIGASSLGMDRDKSIKLTSLDYREGGIKRMAVGDNLALVVTYQTGTGE